MDHSNPVVDVENGWTNWEDYLDGLFVKESDWKILCLECHASKTLRENEERRK